jgi:hypothetical protein
LFPFLSLEHVNLDVEIAQRLSRRLAYYHLALPIAEDADGITVAMAHPENANVVRVLEGALNATVIPVRSSASTIREQLDRIWQVQVKPGALRVILWAKNDTAVESAAGYADGLMSALGREAQIERLAAESFAAGQSADLVIAVAEEHVPEGGALYRSQASLLLLHDAPRPPRAILHLLRGHIPDYRVQDWLVPLAKQHSAEVTLLMGVDGEEADGGQRKKRLVSDLSNILMARDKRQAHIMECRRTLQEAGIRGRLKIRQDTLLNAIRAELGERPYDLVAIAAEAYGDFAQEVGALVWPQTSAFLVIKP